MSLNFTEALVANEALEKSIASILGDDSLSTVEKAEWLSESGAQFGEYVGDPDAGAERVEAILRKVVGVDNPISRLTKAHGIASHPDEAAARAAAARRKLERENNPTKDEDEEEEEEAPVTATKGSINEALHSLALSKRQAGETSHQAVARYMETPEGRALYQAYKQAPADVVALEVVKLAPVAAEVEARAAEIRKAQPRLSIHQARAQAYESTPGLLKRAIAEHRGGDEPTAA